MDFKITNPGQAQFKVHVNSWTLKRYQDITTNARELDVTVSKNPGENPPIQQFAMIEMWDGNEVSFRGYVERYKYTKFDKTFYCRGVENLLYHRFCHKFNYAMTLFGDSTSAFFTLGNVIKDHYTGGYPIISTTTDNCPGLLYVANSLMPWGTYCTVYDATKQIIKYGGWGSATRMGTNPVMYYIDDRGVYPLVQRGQLSDLQTYDNSFFINTTDLYIRNTSNTGAGNAGAHDYWYFSGRILAENIFDTKVRIGNVDDYITQLVGFLKTDHTKSVAQVLYSTLQSFGLYIDIRDSANGYTYIDASATNEGRGATNGLYQIGEDECITFEKSIPNKPWVHGLRGYGPAEQVITYVTNPAWKGFWYEDTYSVPNGYHDGKGILWSYTTAEFNNRGADHQYLIETRRKIIARPGDYIQVVPDYEVPEILPINTIQTDDKGVCRLELNHKTPLFTNAWQNAGVLGSTYSNYSVHKFKTAPVTGSCTFNLRTLNYTTCALGTVSLACPDLSTFYNPLVTLDISLNPTTTTFLIDPLRYIVLIGVGSPAAFNENSIIYNYAFGDSISNIDITSLVTSNAANVISIQLFYLGGIPGSTGCTGGNTGITANVTMSFWNRLDLNG